jgi:hypothetical protein
MSHPKVLSLLFFVAFGLFFQNSFAQNNDEGLDQVCGLSSGSWHTSASGWACCWSNWGCYGCTSGNCLMNCHTKRCKKANGMSKVSIGKIAVPELAPKGMKAPIVPDSKSKVSGSEMSKTNNFKN